MDLFPELLPPRARPRVLMHVFDAGTAHCGRAEDLGKPICRMSCSRCKVKSGWLVFDTISEAKRGVACPKCNPPGTPGVLNADYLERQDLNGKPPAELSP
ncbi:hypothetical protein [Azohydromonas lata]|uniref:Uncharacterized protein n=1 Tax=Azohydromonas lata TaxID=45677 RepID=A0ABU5IK48_9BURK|nr:hypothetical protein [Azohydromonas lata]MDZ5459261.1 hypothetical protein [Azohydromonas lata]